MCDLSLLNSQTAISAGTDGSPRSRVCERLTLHSAPHRHQRKCSGACLWERVKHFFFKFWPEFLFLLVRSPCKISEPYDNPFWGFNNGGKKKKSAVILPEERGYIVGRARLYSRKSAVILSEERGYIPGRVRLYFCTENSGLPKLLRWSHALRSDQLVALCLNKRFIFKFFLFLLLSFGPSEVRATSRAT